MSPTWEKAPQKNLSDALSKAWEQLADEISDNPPVEDVVGVSSEALAQHAIEAIDMLVKMDEANPMDPNFWVRLYSLGFVVGCKYGEAKQNPRSG